VWVVFEINRSAFPIDLEGVGFVRKAGKRGAIVWKRAEVFVFPSNSLASVRSTSSDCRQRLGWSCCLYHLATCWSREFRTCSDRSDSSRGSDCCISSTSGLQQIVLPQLCQLSLGPQSRIGVECPGHLRLELERELIFAVTRRRDFSKCA